MPKYLGIELALERDNLFSEQGKQLTERYYAKDGAEGVQKAIARAANCFSYGDKELAQFIYDAASKHWFFFSSPIFSNGVEGTWDVNPHWDGKKWNEQFVWNGEAPKAMPIACFLSHAGDSIKEQIETSSELAFLSVMGGGTSVHSAIRAVSDKAPGPIPYIKTIDGLMGYYRQGKTRRGSTAVYLDISHPDVVEFIGMRKPSGGDPARKINNRAGVHNAVNISDAFRQAVDTDSDWKLICPHTKEVKETVKARWLWEELLATRELTGEPYLYLIDEANRKLPQAQKDKGLRNNGSNLCSEITLATSASRTAVCCLSSVNLETWDEWRNSGLISKLVRFLDNVIQWFIDYAPPELSRAVNSARAERAIGIGAMGWHNYLMSKMIPFESGGFNSASQHLNIIFSGMAKEGDEESRRLASERSEPSDLIGTGRRNSHLFAIAPNANSSVLCNTSPSIEPILSNAYTQKSRAGIHLVKNKFLEQYFDRLLDQGYFIDLDATWKSIIANNGSVQHLGFLSNEVKKVFKTAWEIDQHWVVQHTGDIQQYICQAISTNLFFLPGSDRAYINSVHMKWLRDSRGKSLYYFRTGSAAAADTVKEIQRQSLKDWSQDNEECVACQG